MTVTAEGIKAHDEFVKLNPKRHTRGGGMCMVCGVRPLHGLVYCGSHRKTFSGSGLGWGQARFYPMLYDHPEFNGIPTGMKLVDSEWIADLTDAGLMR